MARGTRRAKRKRTKSEHEEKSTSFMNLKGCKDDHSLPNSSHSAEKRPRHLDESWPKYKSLMDELEEELGDIFKSVASDMQSSEQFPDLPDEGGLFRSKSLGDLTEGALEDLQDDLFSIFTDKRDVAPGRQSKTPTFSNKGGGGETGKADLFELPSSSDEWLAQDFFDIPLFQDVESLIELPPSQQDLNHDSGDNIASAVKHPKGASAPFTPVFSKSSPGSASTASANQASIPNNKQQSQSRLRSLLNPNLKEKKVSSALMQLMNKAAYVRSANLVKPQNGENPKLPNIVPSKDLSEASQKKMSNLLQKENGIVAYAQLKDSNQLTPVIINSGLVTFPASVLQQVLNMKKEIKVEKTGKELTTGCPASVKDDVVDRSESTTSPLSEPLTPHNEVREASVSVLAQTLAQKTLPTEIERFVICSDGDMQCVLCTFTTESYSVFKSHIICSHPHWRITKKLSKSRLLVERSADAGAPLKTATKHRSFPSKVQSEESNRIFRCIKCVKTFAYERSVANHLVEKHKNEEHPLNNIEISTDSGVTFKLALRCSQSDCLLMCDDAEYLRRHERDDHPTLLFRCQLCGYTAPNPESVRSHGLRAHRQQLTHVHAASVSAVAAK